MLWAAAWQLPLSLLRCVWQGCPRTVLSPHHHHLFLCGESRWHLQLDNQFMMCLEDAFFLFLKATAVTCRQVPHQFCDPCLSLLPALCHQEGQSCIEKGAHKWGKNLQKWAGQTLCVLVVYRSSLPPDPEDIMAQKHQILSIFITQIMVCLG